MRTFNHVLFFACLALLGVVAIIEGLSAPVATVHQQTQQASANYDKSAAGPETQATSDTHDVASTRLRAVIGQPLQQAVKLTVAGKYAEALKLVDGLNTVPNKTAKEVALINQMHDALIVMRQRGAQHI